VSVDAEPVPADKVPEVWQRMGLDEFWASGLLWRANQVLWPFGVALTMRTDESGQVVEMYVTKTEPFAAIASGDTPQDEAERMNRFVEWVKERVGDVR